MPRAWASRTTSLAGTSVPSVFDMCVIATILCARRQELLEFVDEEIALVVHRRPLDHRALALTQEVQGTMLNGAP